ncbi:MAG: hypothetical protein ABI361_09945 [Nitrososphaera sp.]
MIIGPRRAALIASIAAVGLTIVLYPLIVETPIDVNKFDITLTGISASVDPNNDQNLILKPTFTVTNHNDRTLTTSKIDYDIMANGTKVASGSLSYEDVPLNGRPALFTDSSIPVTDSTTMQYSDSNAALFKAIRANSTSLNWSVQGSTDIESGTTLVSKTFSSNLQK